MTPGLSRRAVVRALAVGSVPAAAGKTAGETVDHATASGRWTQHGASGANTNSTEDRGPQYNQHTDWLVELPSADTAPLVVDDTVVVLDLSGGDVRVHGRHAGTGAERFTRTLDSTVVSGVLAADAQRVYTAAVVSPSIRAISVPDGTAAWQTTLDGTGEADGAEPALGASGGFRTPPRLHDGRLYLQSRSRGPQGGGVLALEAATGELTGVFTGTFSDFAVGPEWLVGTRASPSLGEWGLTCLSTAGGERRFRYSTAGRPGSPTIGDQRVFVGTSENRLHAVGPGGETLWTSATDGWAVSLALGSRAVLAQTDDSLVAYDVDTGNRRWETTAGTPRPVVANGHVYVGREQGFDCYELASGDRVATYRNRRLDGSMTHLSVAGSSLYATAPRGAVLAVEERFNRLLPVPL